VLVDEDDRERSWAEILTETERIGHALRRRGVTESDRVLLSTVNSDVSVLTVLALLELGVSIGLVDRGISQERCAALVADSGARWFVSDHDHLDAPFDRVGVGWIPLTDLANAEPAPPAEGTLTFARWAERQDGLIVWTSGSLGRPKGLVRTGGSVLRNVARTQERMGYTENDVLLPLLPFTHQYGLSMLLLWWQARATLTLVPSRRIDVALDTIARRAVTVVDAVPAVYEGMLRMVSHGRANTERLGSVRMWCVGGEPLQDDLRQRFADEMGQPLLDGYGSSEAGNIALATPENAHHCGRPLDGITVTVLDDAGVAVPAGRIGEVVVTSPDIMAGTLEPGGRVRPIHRPAYHTQDLGFLDEDGNVRVLGRKAAVHRFGNTLYPDAIAAQVASCGAPVRVLPVENGRFGTELVFAVADPTGRPAAHWRRVFAGLVAESEQPNKVVVLPEFPRHSNGKTDLVKLGEIAAAAIAPRRGTSAVSTRTPNIGQATDLSSVAFADRITALQDLVRMLTERRAEVLRILTEVSNHRTASDEIDASIEALEGAVAELIRYAPPAVDQISVLMPSNIPLYGYILYLVIPSLYSRRLVFRPSRSIEDQTRKLHELLSAEHGLPIVLDSSGQREFMTTQGARSDVLVFTGTYDNAEQIRQELPRTTLFCFYGQGVNPFIVGADADLGDAVDGLLRVRMLNSGQDCFGPDVVFVHAAVSAHFLNLLCRKVESLRYGPLDDPLADYGPMFYQEAFESTLDYLRNKRDMLAAGSQINFMDSHLRPTVLIHPTDTTFLPPELFAPVFNVVPFTNTEWLHEMLTHPYYAERAMAATVFGALPETVERLRKRHTVSVDETLIEVENGNRPFGGKGIRANYVSLGKKRFAEPLLLSKAIADHLPRSS
jgi:acyl-coenzyme A synthetase/AMP-(fatty) acid ligase/acyl-CoA reductase-like NAD-dependent aldehyde dehydrogenase